MTIDEKTKQSKQEYNREYYAKNREKLNAYKRRWRDENPEKQIKMQQTRAMRERLKRFRKTAGRYWVSVKDLLPKLIEMEPMDGLPWSRSDEVLVIVKCDGGKTVIAKGHYAVDEYSNPSRAWVLDDDTILTNEVTHWMPLPEPPKEET